MSGVTKRGATEGAGSAAKVRRTPVSSMRTSPTTLDMFELGISLHGLRALAATAEGRSCREMWRQVWLHETVEPGWTAEPVYDAAGDGGATRWLKTVYTNRASGEQMQSTRGVPWGVAAETDGTARGAPSGCMPVMVARADLSPHIGRATHFMSFPWAMPFRDIVDAAATTLGESTECFVWVHMLVHNFHLENNRGADCFDDYLPAMCEAMGRLSLVQVCSKWSDPERMTRLWMMVETSIAVSNDSTLHLALTHEQRNDMADSLRDNGPEAILDVVFKMEFDPTIAVSRYENDRAALLKVIDECCAKVGGRHMMNLKLAEASRRAYAIAIEIEFEQRWQARETPGADVLDLGHQLGKLWALTYKPQKAQELFRRVLSALKDQGEDETRLARMDRTTAELVKVLNTEEAHTAECDMSPTNELAVSWEGVSIAFLQRFVEDHRESANFMSTDAVVERIIKPVSASKVLYDPEPKGRALIEMTHSQYKGAPTLFLSHAWRQTFSVCDRDWRGGLAQALIHAIPEEERRSTFVWADIFCVNQHLRSPYGGLLAFAFEPLRNAMLGCESVLMFFETWDDPAPLTRVWCLDELRNAMLLGKSVQVIMPPQALDSFRKAAAEDPPAMLQDIERVVGRIDIEQASSTFRSDRTFVLHTVEETLGAKPLNSFCCEIVRKALIAAAGLEDHVDRSERWVEIFSQLEQKEQDARTKVPQRIEILRGMAMMKRRIFERGSEEYQDATRVLKKAEAMSEKFYGQHSQTSADIKRQFSLCTPNPGSEQGKFFVDARSAFTRSE